jgi:hypothetical protein
MYCSPLAQGRAFAGLLRALSRAVAGLLAPGKEDQGAVIEALLDPASSDAVLRLALRHRLGPLLHEVVRRTPEGARLTGTLAPAVRESALVNALTRDELAQASSVLSARGVSHLLFKGAGLAWHAYPNPAWRPYSDVDLLVRQCDLGSAEEALQAAGYEPLHEPRRDWFRREHYHWSYSRGAARPTVELHWRLARRGWHLDALWRQVWASPLNVVLEGMPFQIPAPEEHFVTLCVHGSKHRWDTLMWVMDLLALAGTGVDWERVEDLAARARCKGFLRAALLTVRLWTGRDLLPRASAAADRDAVAGAFAAWCAERLAAEAEDRPLPAQIPEPGLLRERWLDRVYFRVVGARGRLVMWMTPTATDRQWVPLPRGLHGLYYLLRPVRVAAKVVARMRRRAR